MRAGPLGTMTRYSLLDAAGLTHQQRPPEVPAALLGDPLGQLGRQRQTLLLTDILWGRETRCDIQDGSARPSFLQTFYGDERHAVMATWRREKPDDDKRQPLPMTTRTTQQHQWRQSKPRKCPEDKTAPHPSHWLGCGERDGNGNSAAIWNRVTDCRQYMARDSTE